jgi:hypothetical protein
MSFDKNNAAPVVQPQKRMTNVHVRLIAGVLIFLAIGVAAVDWMHATHG